MLIMGIRKKPYARSEGKVLFRIVRHRKRKLFGQLVYYAIKRESHSISYCITSSKEKVVRLVSVLRHRKRKSIVQLLYYVTKRESRSLSGKMQSSRKSVRESSSPIPSNWFVENPPQEFPHKPSRSVRAGAEIWKLLFGEACLRREKREYVSFPIFTANRPFCFRILFYLKGKVDFYLTCANWIEQLFRLTLAPTD